MPGWVGLFVGDSVGCGVYGSGEVGVRIDIGGSDVDVIDCVEIQPVKISSTQIKIPGPKIFFITFRRSHYHHTSISSSAMSDFPP